MIHELTVTREAYLELSGLSAELPQLFQQGCLAIVIDLGATPMVDSMMLGQLVRIQLACNQRGAVLQLRNVSTNARRTFDFSGLGELFGLSDPEPPRFGG